MQAAPYGIVGAIIAISFLRDTDVPDNVQQESTLVGSDIDEVSKNRCTGCNEGGKEVQPNKTIV